MNRDRSTIREVVESPVYGQSAITPVCNLDTNSDSTTRRLECFCECLVDDFCANRKRNSKFTNLMWELIVDGKRRVSGVGIET